ncbi:MAG: SIS domain-containing protein [Chryseolinea sp.]
MKYLGIETDDLNNLGAIHTAREISQQPEIWEQVGNGIEAQLPALQAFLSEATANVHRILLTGAGTSAFIGISLRGVFQRNFGLLTEAVPSTDIVSHPKDYFHKDISTLVVSFARSGNSPESVAAITLADELSTRCYHLIITCNSEGQLAKYQPGSRKYVYCLPPNANDLSLAMTSSYSGMLLAGLLCARIKNFQQCKKMIASLVIYGKRILDHFPTAIKKIANKDFRRAVFLGSGPFYGTATESHLKLQELTDGKVICKSDTFLGFRHGPKAVVNEATIVVYFFSNDDYALQYEKDLLDDMQRGTTPMLEVGFSESPFESRLSDLFVLSDGLKVDEEFLCVCYVVPAQILGFYKSMQLGLRPDTPSASGAITRVVQGVEIYTHSSMDMKINPVL